MFGLSDDTSVLGFVFSSRTFRDPCTCLRDGTYSVPCNPRRVSPFCKHASVRNMVLRGVGCCSQPSHAHCQCHSCAWDTVPVAAHAEAYRDARPRGVRVERPDIRNVCARGHRQANERNVVCVRKTSEGLKTELPLNPPSASLQPDE